MRQQHVEPPPTHKAVIAKLPDNFPKDSQVIKIGYVLAAHNKKVGRGCSDGAVMGCVALCG